MQYISQYRKLLEGVLQTVQTVQALIQKDYETKILELEHAGWVHYHIYREGEYHVWLHPSHDMAYLHDGKDNMIVTTQHVKEFLHALAVMSDALWITFQKELIALVKEER